MTTPSELEQVNRRTRNMREKQNRIFDAASRLFAEKGFRAVTTQEISDRADIAAGTLFRYASSKGQLLLMVYNEDFRAALDSGERLARAERDPVAAITALVRPILAAADRNTENTIAYQRELLFGPPDETYRAQGLALVARLESAMSDILVTAVDPVATPAQREAARIAGRSIFAVLHMTLVHPATGADSGAADLSAQITQLVAGFRAGPGSMQFLVLHHISQNGADMNSIRKVTVLGTGVLGSQIAFQTAFRGFDVTSYDISDEALTAARDRFGELAAIYREQVAGAGDDKAESTAAAIALTTDLAEAAGDADLIIEAVPEVLSIKQDTYRKLGTLAPEHAIFATNSSTLLPSDIKDYTGRPDRFLALHFANQVWHFNTAEVMGTEDTDPAVYEAVVEFARAIGMVPIELHKEKAGYVLNSLLVPFLNSAMSLAAGGYAEPDAVDETWRIGTGAPAGPFQILDIVGLTTPYNILINSGEDGQKLAGWLKSEYIDKGKLGVTTGEGFYRYS